MAQLVARLDGIEEVAGSSPARSTNMLIDTHAHINFNAYKKNGDEVIKRALQNDVFLINVGSQYATSQRAVEYAKKYPEGVFAAVGLHPIHTKGKKIKEEINAWRNEREAEEFDYEAYKKLAQEPKVVAIGEMGLDYYHLDKGQEEEQKILQKENFLKQLKLAQELNKPVIVHCREAHNDLIEILKNYKLAGVLHSFSGRWSQAQEYLEMGFYLGFNGIITFARDYDRVVAEAPLERLLVETDCPYLTPIPYRGKRNEPLYVKYVAEKIAELRGINFEEVAGVTTRNARELFGV